MDKDSNSATNQQPTPQSHLLTKKLKDTPNGQDGQESGAS